MKKKRGGKIDTVERLARQMDRRFKDFTGLM